MKKLKRVDDETINETITTKISGMKKAELKKHLNFLGEKSSGNKDEMVKRLKDALLETNELNDRDEADRKVVEDFDFIDPQIEFNEADIFLPIVQESAKAARQELKKHKQTEASFEKPEQYENYLRQLECIVSQAEEACVAAKARKRKANTSLKSYIKDPVAWKRKKANFVLDDYKQMLMESAGLAARSHLQQHCTPSFDISNATVEQLLTRCTYTHMYIHAMFLLILATTAADALVLSENVCIFVRLLVPATSSTATSSTTTSSTATSSTTTSSTSTTSTTTSSTNRQCCLRLTKNISIRSKVVVEVREV